MTDNNNLLTNVLIELANKKIHDDEYGTLINNFPKFSYLDFMKGLDVSNKSIEIFFLAFPKTIEDTLRNIECPERISCFFTIEEAENSRNDGDESKFRIVIIRNSDMAKASSLRWFSPITVSEAYIYACNYTKKNIAESNQFLNSLIGALKRKQIQNILSFEGVLSYLQELLNANAIELPKKIKDCYYLLGLLSDKTIDIDNPNVSDIAKSIKHNHEVVEKISNLEKQERANISSYYSVAQSNKNIPRLIINYYQTRNIELLSKMDLQDVEVCLKASQKKKKSSKKVAKNISHTQAAAELVFGGSDTDADFGALIDDINNKTGNRSNPEKEESISVNTKNKDGEDINVSIDEIPVNIQIANEYTSEDNYGIVIEAEVNSPLDAINNQGNYNSKILTYDFLSGTIQLIEESKIILEDKASELLTKLNNYLDARKTIVPFKERLQDVPLFQVLAQYKVFSDYLDSYTTLLDALANNITPLWHEYENTAISICSDILALDNIYVIGKEKRHAIPTPLNPLYLWKYIKLAEEIRESKNVSSTDEVYLSEDDKQFIIRKADEIPDPLTLMLFPANVNESNQFSMLPLAGHSGNLPIYSTDSQISDYRNDLDEVQDAIIRYIALYPHSSLMLKIVLIDPPTVESVVEMLKSLNNNNDFDVEGVDVSIYRTHEAPKTWVEIENDSLNDGMLSKANSDASFKFNFKITDERFKYTDVIDDLKSPVHLLIMFDPQEVATTTSKNNKYTHLNPLCVPRNYVFNPMNNEVKIEPVTEDGAEGSVFTSYSSILGRFNNLPYNTHTSTFANTPIKKDTYQSLLNMTDWLIVIDEDLQNWDISLMSASDKLYFKEGNRCLGIYSKNASKFVRGYDTLVKQFGNYIPQEKGLIKIIETIRNVNDDGLLSIISHGSNREFDVNHGKGSLGLAISTIHNRKLIDDSIIVGLDTQLAQEWLSQRDDGELPDLIQISFDSEKHAIINLIEVKTYDKSSNSFQIDDSGKIQGHAVDQVSILESLVKEMVGTTEKITTISRREVLKQQVYGTLLESSADKTTKMKWCDNLNQLFSGRFGYEINKIISFVDFNHEPSKNEYFDGRDDSHPGEKYILQTIGSIEIQNIISGNDYEIQEDGKVIAKYSIDADRQTPIVSDHPENIEGSTSNEKAETLNGSIDNHDSNLPSNDISNITDSNQDTPSVSSDEIENSTNKLSEDIVDKCHAIDKVLRDYGIQAKPIDPTKVLIAARFTRFLVELKSGEKMATVTNRKEDIGIQLASEGEILIERVNGTKYIALDVPFGGDVKPISLLDNLHVLDEKNDGCLDFIAGQKPDGTFQILDLNRAPHILVAGSTGSGKTVFLYTLIVSLLYKYGVQQTEFLIIDPKQTDFVFFDELPNLYKGKIFCDVDETMDVLSNLYEEEGKKRFDILRKARCRDIESYNQKHPEKPMKHLIVVFDEYADLISNAEVMGKRKDTERMIIMLAQKVRSVGIHLVIATQRTTAQFVTGNLKVNLPYRISFKLGSHVDSQTILDEPGAENLLGHGDMIVKTDNDIMRLQGLYIDVDKELPGFLASIINR